MVRAAISKPGGDAPGVVISACLYITPIRDGVNRFWLNPRSCTRTPVERVLARAARHRAASKLTQATRSTSFAEQPGAERGAYGL